MGTMKKTIARDRCKIFHKWWIRVDSLPILLPFEVFIYTFGRMQAIALCSIICT